MLDQEYWDMEWSKGYPCLEYQFFAITVNHSIGFNYYEIRHDVSERQLTTHEYILHKWNLIFATH